MSGCSSGTCTVQKTLMRWVRGEQSAGPGDRLEARAVDVGLAAVALPARDGHHALQSTLVRQLRQREVVVPGRLPALGHGGVRAPIGAIGAEEAELERDCPRSGQGCGCATLAQGTRHDAAKAVLRVTHHPPSGVNVLIAALFTGPLALVPDMRRALEVRPTSQSAAQIAVGRTSVDRLGLGARQAISRAEAGFSAALQCSIPYVSGVVQLTVILTKEGSASRWHLGAYGSFASSG